MKERPFYLGLTGIPIAVGMLLGPIIGALLCFPNMFLGDGLVISTYP